MEIKGRYDDEADMKAKAGRRWVRAVSQLGGFGRWDYVVIEDPQKLPLAIDGLADTAPDTAHLMVSG